MPRLSLYKPEKGNDFNFIDRNVGEMFQVGGTDAYIHKYISPNDQGELNDATQPEDPYEFMDLLTNTEMASLERNNMLLELASILRHDKSLQQKLKQGDDTDFEPGFKSMVDEFIEKFGDLSCAVTGGKDCLLGTEPLFRLLLA